MFLANIHGIKEKTVPRKSSFLLLPYLGPLSLQARSD